MTDARVDPVDDLPHAVGAAHEFSESFYYQFGDPVTGLSGFLRLSNRPNEGRGERTVCLFLSDGRVALSFDRPVFADPAVFDAGGMQILIDEPLVAHRVSFAGNAHVLGDPWAMNDPKRALDESPLENCSVELGLRAIAPAQPFSLDELGDFTPNHYEQFMAAQGVVRLGNDEFRVQAHGMRDRGWGPRSWQAPRFYRWMFGCCEGMGFAAGVMGRDGVVGTGGFVWEGGEMLMLDDVVATTEYDGDAVASVAVELRAGDRSWSIQGLPQTAVPLRNRRRDTGQVTRILETAVRWSSDGHEMLGIAEFLDQVIDGRPVGIAEHDSAAR